MNYDLDSWKSIRSVFPTLDVRTRAQLLDDSLSLAQAGMMDYDIALDMTR